MAELWVWADPHLDHPAILHFCGRPFPNLMEMNAALIDNYNADVGPKDDVLFLGDYAFRNHARHLARLRGNKTFVFGNHDRMPLDTLRNFTRVVGSSRCPGIIEMAIGKYQLCFSHYPLASWNGSFHGTWNVHGHCHGRMPESATMLRMDAGVDLFNYRPVNIDVIIDKLSARMPAWRERMRQLQFGESDAAFKQNRDEASAYVKAWKARMAANPAAFAMDYRQRYAQHSCSHCDACEGNKSL